MRLALSDVLAVLACAVAVYGLALVHPAAACLGAAVALGAVAVELGKQERRRYRRRESSDE